LAGWSGGNGLSLNLQTENTSLENFIGDASKFGTIFV
jgi:hypothetical protein